MSFDNLIFGVAFIFYSFILFLFGVLVVNRLITEAWDRGLTSTLMLLAVLALLLWVA